MEKSAEQEAKELRAQNEKLKQQLNRALEDNVRLYKENQQLKKK